MKITLLIIALFVSVFSFAQELIYLEPTQPIEKRVEDLLSRMALEENVGQLNINSK